MRYGVETARRGWLRKEDVLNTLPPEKLLSSLRPIKQGRVTSRKQKSEIRKR